MRFEELQLIEPLMRALTAAGYETPSPIQALAIPPALLGRDILGVAQTGTGKTAAFALPILQRLAGAPTSEAARPANPDPRARTHAPGHLSHPKRYIRALVLAPTRELASQVHASFTEYGRHLRMKSAVVFGGVGQGNQVNAMRAGIDILVACPGRLLDLMGQGYVDLSRLEVFVLDEADRMLDMGFVNDIRRIQLNLPKRRQTLFFSATMPPEIQRLADSMLTDPVPVSIAPVRATAELVENRLYFVEKKDKPLLLNHLLADPGAGRVVIFTRTKHGANKVSERLAKDGVKSEAIHSNKSQGARERALSNFKRGATRVLVATDIAARGLDVDNVTHVVNFDLPNEPETFVHRIGRTGRAGASGIAYSFCDVEERGFLADIERLLKKTLPRVEDNPFKSNVPDHVKAPPPQPAGRGGRGGNGGGGGGGGRRPGSSAGGGSGRPAVSFGNGRDSDGRREAPARFAGGGSNVRSANPDRDRMMNDRGYPESNSGGGSGAGRRRRRPAGSGVN